MAARKPRPDQPKKPSRLQLDIPPELRRRFHEWCFLHETTMTDEVLAFIEKRVESFHGISERKSK